LGKLPEGRRFALRPGAQHLALGVVERGGDRMPAPQARALRSAALMRDFAARHGCPMGGGEAPRNPESRQLSTLFGNPSTVLTPGADEEDDQDRIAPEALGRAIDLGHEISVDGS